ncbi:GNAT family N-acetyltransferase [bacterium AH-315-K03]|nr:GNAT family N-acetyltransferase [bacterium AH-315-K03]
MGWFASESELYVWAGPDFRYPFDQQSFKDDLKLNHLHSFSLINASEDLISFGQCYLRMGKCHLARLVVSPHFRGQGMVQVLMQKLIEFGESELGVNSSSLFVLRKNRRAISSYKKFGFTVAVYPENIPIDDCLYMLKSC